MGSEKSPGNILCGVSGHVKQPGIFEVPLGISLRELIEAPAYGGGILGDRALKAFLPGGSSSGFLPAKDVDVLLTHDDLQAKGSMLGTASVIVLDESADIVRSTRIITDFYHDESCGQCTQCREGTAWLAAILRRIENGDGQSGDIDSMLELCANMKGKTICVLSDACAWPIELAIKHFRQDFEDAIRGARSTVAFTDGAITDRAFTYAAARGAQSPGAVTPGAGE